MEERRRQAAIEREERYQLILRKRLDNRWFRKRRRQRKDSNNSVISNLAESLDNLFLLNPNNPYNPSNMAGQAAGVNFDRNDPIFNNLDPEVQAHLNGLLAQQVAAARQVHEHRINSTNIHIEIPVYDHKSMTSDTYLQKCRTYLLAQGHPPALFHELLPMILKGEYKLWYDTSVIVLVIGMNSRSHSSVVMITTAFRGPGRGSSTHVGKGQTILLSNSSSK
jgi:hypothetical protein